jgi:exodeoxyribonuclease III
MKIGTWNVNGIRARHAQVREWIEREQPDVVCLQELKAKREQVPETLCELAGYWCYWHGASAYSGVGLHVRKERFREPPVFAHPAFDHETRIVEATLGDLVVASVYVPNGGKDYAAKIAFVQAMIDYAEAMRVAGRTLVICGDLNIARAERDVHPKERKPNIIGQRPEERALFARLLEHGLVDVARALEPDNDGLFTWWAPWRNLRERNIGWRLDYVLASAALAARAASCPTFREFGTSDHAPVLATFAEP